MSSESSYSSQPEQPQQSQSQQRECVCKECSKNLSQMTEIHEHFDKMYDIVNANNKTIQQQNDSISKTFAELVPLLKSLHATLKQNQTMLEKLSN